MEMNLLICIPWRLSAACLAAVLLLTGCAGGIDQTALTARLAGVENRPALLDVRTTSEYRAGHLPGAVNLPVQALPFNLDLVPVSERNVTVVVYCAHGPRAGLAGFFLRMGGFSQVLHLHGDFNGWQRAGLPVVTGVEPGTWTE